MIENVRRALSHLNIFFFFFFKSSNKPHEVTHPVTHRACVCVRARDLGDRQLAGSPSPEKAWSSYQRSSVPLPCRQPAAHPRPVAADVLRGVVGPWSPVTVRRPGGGGSSSSPHCSHQVSLSLKALTAELAGQPGEPALIVYRHTKKRSVAQNQSGFLSLPHQRGALLALFAPAASCRL